MANIDLEKIRVEALTKVTRDVKNDAAGEMVKALLDASSKVTKEMLTQLLAELDGPGC